MNDLTQAKDIFAVGGYAFVMVKDGALLATGTREGAGELLDAITELEGTARGASLADRVVGKAVAMVAVYAGLSAVWTPLGSEAAEKVLRDYNIPFEMEKTVPLIRNKRDDGPCPMERLTMPFEVPSAAVNALREFVAERRAGVPLH